MNMIETKRKLIKQANLLATTNDATTTLTACAALLDAAGTLMSQSDRRSRAGSHDGRGTA